MDIRKVATILFFAVSIVTVAQDSVKLRLSYKKGDVYVANMKLSQDMGAVMSMGTNVDMSIKITNVEADTYDSEMKIEKMTMDMLQGGTAMSYDSSKKDEDLDQGGLMMKNQISPMLTAVIFAKGNNLGEVLDIKVEPNVPGMSDFGDQPSTVIYPKESVKVGTVWTAKKESKGMIFDFSYKVTAITKTAVFVDVSGIASGISTGDLKGTIEIDRISGVPKESILEMDLKVQGQDMNTKVSMTMVKK